MCPPQRKQSPREQQLTLFPTKPHTRYTWHVEALIEKMRRGFIEPALLEERLVNLGLFDDPEDIDVLWAHSIYDEGGTMPKRDAFVRRIWNPILAALDLLNEKGMRYLPQARRLLLKEIIARRTACRSVIEQMD